MPRRILTALAVLSAVVVPAGAAEFVPGWKSDVVWDSNVLQSSTDEQSDFSFRNGPTLRFREPEGNLTYDASYQLTYEAFTRLQGINVFDQYFNGTSEWRATPTTTVSLSDYFAYTSSLSGIFESTGIGPDQVSILSLNRQRYTVNSGHASVTHQLSPRWQLTVSGDNQYTHYQNDLQSDALSFSGSAQVTRSITPRLIVGGGLQFQRQHFSGTSLTADRGTNFYQGFGVFQYQISPTLSLFAQGGPAYAVPDQPKAVSQQTALTYFRVDPSTCQNRLPDGTAVFRPTSRDNTGGCAPSVYVDFFNGEPVGTPDSVPQSNTLVDVPFVGEQQSLDSSLNYFGRVSLDKVWRLWHASISYDRSANSSSGLGTSTTLDVFSGELTYRPSALWNIRLTGSYSTQTAISTGRSLQYAVVPGVLGPAFLQIRNPDGSTSPALAEAVIGIPTEASLGAKLGNAYDYSAYFVELRAERRISRRLTLDGTLSWRQQSTKGDLVVAADQTVYRVIVGFTWNFEPIPL